MNKKSFILHVDKLDIITDLDMEERGRLFTAIYEYQKSGSLPSKDFLKESYYLFKGSFVPQFEADNKKYTAMIERNRKNGVKNVKRNTNVSTQWDPVATSGCESVPVDTSGSLTDTVTVTETVTETDFNKNIHSSCFYINEKKDEGVLEKNDQENIQDLKTELDLNKAGVKTIPDGLFELEAPKGAQKKKRASRDEPKKKHHSIPEDFELTDDLINFAFNQGDKFEIAWDANIIRLEFEKFKSHYKNARGYVARKLDWQEAFKSWILKSISFKVEARNLRPVFYTNPQFAKQEKEDKWALLNQAVAGKKV